MGFSDAFLLSSAVSGLVIIAAAIRGKTRGASWYRATAAASGVIGGHALLLTLGDFGLFARAHVAYLLATVTPGVVAVGLVVAGRGRRLALVLLLPGLVGIYATHIEPNRLRVDRVELGVDVKSADGVRIGVLADLQTPNIGEHERDAIDRLIAERPDFVLIAGDLWQMSDEQIEEDWPQFAALVQELVDAVGTVVIVEGDTDHIGWLDRIGEQTGAHIAHNRVIAIDLAGTAVLVGGTELVAGNPRPAARAAMAELVAAEGPSVITIALSHRPGIANWLAGSVDLVVAGHTHGGQVAVPLLGPLVTLSDVPREVAGGGLHTLDGQPIYVSTGVGLERNRAPQVRLGARPSIGVITLRFSG